ncbi:LIC_10907 family protein [Leptospira adleri]|uniref:LIC_10907 family protein n=1 Tax=Leptospira adleri TaxID=2023186 RepID=UPI003B8A876A
MSKWYDSYELEFSLGALPRLKEKIKESIVWKKKKEKAPMRLRLEILILRLFLKKRILIRRLDWSKNELKFIFSEKVVLQNLLEERENQFILLEKENFELKRQLESLGFIESSGRN